MSVANQRQVFLFKLCSFGINLVTFAKFVVKMISVASSIKKRDRMVMLVYENRPSKLFWQLEIFS